MKTILALLIDRLQHRALESAKVIPWGSPVPSFGNLENAQVATLGLNPSNREFVNAEGDELQGEERRFHTLSSLGIEKWSDIGDSHLDLIVESCKEYFLRNPYDGWFKRLDNLISGTNTSYYTPLFGACHLDLIPYATEDKWVDLSQNDKEWLLKSVGDVLGLLIHDSNIEVLILNGRTVVDTLEQVSNVEFNIKEYSDWLLPRKNSGGVKGFAFTGFVSQVNSVDLGREVNVLGFNHNIQSSFGVSRKVTDSIRRWIGQEVVGFA